MSTSEQTSPRRMRVAVIGLGGIGGVAAASLTLAGRHDVVACGRRPLDRMKLHLPDREPVDVAMTTLTDPGDARPVDWVLLATKAQDTASAAPWLQQLCSPRTVVAVLQNGVDHSDRIAPFANGANALPTIVYYNGERIAPDHVRMRHISDVDISLPETPNGAAFTDLMAGTAIATRPSADFTTEMWRKLLINIVVNPITALTRQRQKVLRRDDVQDLAASLLTEAVAVARAEGAAMDPQEVERVLAQIRTFPEDAGSSMYFDVMAERPLEAEALTGAVVRAGGRHGIATPMNRAILTLATVLSDGLR